MFDPDGTVTDGLGGGRLAAGRARPSGLSHGGMGGHRTVRLLLGLLALEGGARAVGFLAYTLFTVPFPHEIWFLEPKMVHLAWRVQAGIQLYPDWTAYPHVANFFGPVYFGLVGLLGRAAGADLRQLFLIGRLVTVSASLLTTLVVGVYLARRYGRAAGLVGASLTLGSAPMYDFAVMARPDTMAELLGFAGYLLSGRRSLAGCLSGCALLALAVLTKQTAVIFLAASVAALALEHEPRRAAIVLGAASSALAAAVALGSFWEPHFIAGLLGESRTPWDFTNWLRQATDLARLAPDLLVCAVAGLVLWVREQPRDLRPAVLTVAILGWSLVTSAKVGSDRNYFLSLRIIEGLAAGSLWYSLAVDRTRARSVPIALIVGLALAPSVVVAGFEAFIAQSLLSGQQLPSGRLEAQERDVVLRLAQRSDVRILTDSGLIQLYQRERAAFVDSWLFRLMVRTGQITPSRMLKMIESEEYDYVITTEDLFSPEYPSGEFSLPMPLLERARAHYKLLSVVARFHLYGPRGR